MPSGQSTSTSTTSSEPSAFQKPYLQKGMDAATKLYNTPGPNYFPNSTVAGFSPTQNAAFGMGSSLANNGDLSQAQQANQNILSGNVNNDAVFNNIKSHVLPAVNSQFESAGRYGSGAQSDALSTGLTNAYAPYAAQQYSDALNRAPMLHNAQWQNVQNLWQQGQQQQMQGQNELGDAVNRFNYNQDLPANKLRQYMGFVGGNYGTNTTSTTPYNTPSIWGQVAGAGLGLAGLFG